MMARLMFTRGDIVQLSDGMVQLGWPRDAVITDTCEAETFQYTLQFADGSLLRVHLNQIKGVL